MNFRSRQLLDLIYELESCAARIPDVCDGGRPEPAHANWAIWGKGGGMKSHDFAVAGLCRNCHSALDQGSKLSAEQREFYWLRGHVETMRQLWERGLLRVETPGLPQKIRDALPGEAIAQFQRNCDTLRQARKRKSRCTPAANQVKRPAGGFA